MDTTTTGIDPIERAWTATKAPATGSGQARHATGRERLLGGGLAAMLSLTLATPGPLLMGRHETSPLDLLVWLGLLGAPVVLLAGIWLTPVAFESLVEAAIVMGSAAAFGGWLLTAALAAIGAASGSGDQALGFAFVLMLGLPVAILLAVILTIPMAALWACLLRGACGRAS